MNMNNNKKDAKTAYRPYGYAIGKNASSGYTVYESYTVKNDEKAAMTNMLFDLKDIFVVKEHALHLLLQKHSL